MARILVTGAAGFIGSHTVDRLLDRGHEVCGVDNFRTGRITNLDPARKNPQFQFQEQDCAAPGALAAIIHEFQPGAIIHLAALVSVPESIANPDENDRLNLQLTRQIVEAARVYGVKRIVFASSAAVYGNNPALPLKEDATCVPLSPYGTAKLASEHLLLEWTRTSGGVARCQRYFNVFGPRQDPSSAYSGVISRFHDALRHNRPAKIHGDGEQTRDFIFVGDVAEANLIAATGTGLPAGVANVCTGRAVSLNELWASCCRAANRRLEAVHGPARAGDIRHSCGSPGRMQRDLGFTAATKLDDGLKALFATGG